MFCTNCGVELSANAQFCVECGTRAEVESVSVAAALAVRRSRVRWAVIGTLAVVVSAVGGAYLYSNHVAKQKVDEAIAELDGKVGVTYGDVSANPLTRSVTISDVKVTSIENKPIEGISAESISFRGNPAKDADPQELDVRVNKLTLDVTRMGPEGAPLVDMGYGTVVVDSRLDYRFSKETGEFDLNHLEIAGQDLLSVGLTLHLGDIDADVASPKDALSRPNMTIRGGELLIKDAVVIERLINKLAEKGGVTPAVYKERLTGSAAALLGGGPGKLEKDVSAAIVRMINDPRSTLRVTIAPEAPVSLEALKRAGDPGTQFTMLNLQVGG